MSPHILVVDGFIAGIDARPGHVPPDWRRLGFVQNEYYPDSPDGGAYFDHALAVTLLRAIVACGDRYVVEHDPPVADLDALAAHYAVAVEPEPPAMVRVYRAGDLVAAVDWIDYMACGGPSPYHDQLSWEVLVRPDLADDLLRNVPAALARGGCPVDHRKASPEPSSPPPRPSPRSGAPPPPSPSWWQRLFG